MVDLTKRLREQISKLTEEADQLVAEGNAEEATKRVASIYCLFDSAAGQQSERPSIELVSINASPDLKLISLKLGGSFTAYRSTAANHSQSFG